MAVIGKIRNRSGLLIGVIGVAMVLFIGGELLRGNSNLFTQQDTNVGTINGVSISYEEFENRVAKVVAAQNLNSSQVDQVRNQVWNQMLQEHLVKAEYGNIGVQVTDEELFEEIKNNPRNPVLVQYFTNPNTGKVYEQIQDEITGELSPQKVMQYIRQVINSENPENWLPVEDAIRNSMLSTKHGKLVKEGLYVSNFDATQKSVEDNKRLSISFVGMAYDEVTDEEITISESDLNSYYNSHKSEAEYQQEETMRGVKLAIWNVTPSEEDVLDTEKSAGDLLESFRTAENDTLFVLQNSDVKETAFETINRYDLPTEIDSLLFAADSQEVFGPYAMSGSYRITKKLATVFVSDSVQARHILIQPSETLDTASAEAKIDSIKAAIKGGADFAKLATDLSADLGSAQNGGDLGWFTQGRMVPEFNDACFNGKVGDMPIVKTQFGFHLIEITDKTAEKEKVQIASVTKIIEPSNETFDRAYNKAMEFSIQNNTGEAFTAALDANEEIEVKEFDFVKEGDKTLGDLESPRNVVRWTYDSEVGTVSDVYELGNQFVVATVTSVKNAGVLPLSEVKDKIEEKVKKEKKAEIIKSKFGGETNMDALAQKLNKRVENAADVNFSSFSVPGIGPDLKILGSVFGMEQGEQSNVLVGENGVYIVRVDNIVPADENANTEILRDQIKRSLSSRVDYEVFEALKDKGGVEDNRHKFF
jgi:peptidyl-prolyl cis-trans isomerase D